MNDSFIEAYSNNIACASTDEVVAFLTDYNAGMGWDDLRAKHEYSSNIYDALCMFKAGMAFQEVVYE